MSLIHGFVREWVALPPACSQSVPEEHSAVGALTHGGAR